MSTSGATAGEFERVQLNLGLSSFLQMSRLGAVSYLNTVPLVWGMLHGEQRENVELSFSLPAECAEQVGLDLIDIGLVPVAEIARQGLEIVPGLGICCVGQVRSILLVSRVPLRYIRTLAADSGSRTSVQLARVILRERYGVEAEITRQHPDLEAMLAEADAALIIGDPALDLDPDRLRYEWLDLGQEWFALTGLPMVFAAWAGKPEREPARLESLTVGSYEFGREHLDEIIEEQFAVRGISKALTAQYLRHNIRYMLGPNELHGLQAFLELAQLRTVSAR